MPTYAGAPGLPSSGPVDVALVRAGILEDLRRHEEELTTLAEEYRQKCARVEDSMRVLRAKYNTVSPIARLLPEILSAVFEAYFSDTHERIVLLHVCREWRRVARGTHRLWTHIIPICEEYTNFALQHSGRLPLVILRNFSSEGDPLEVEKSLQKIMREFPRIRVASFDITNSQGGCWQELPSASACIPSTAPMLRDLRLSIMSGGLKLPFFEALNTPLLNTLDIWHGSVGMLKALRSPTLTSLIVTFFARTSVHAVVEVLDGMPLLEKIHLSNLEPDNFPMPEDAFPPSLGRTIALPHLKQITLQGSPPNIEMARLLNSLLFPRSTEIVYDESMFSLGSWDSPEHYAAVLPILIPKAAASEIVIANHSSMKLRPLCLLFDRNLLDIRIWTSLPNGDMEKWNTTHYEGEDAARLTIYIPSTLSDSISCLSNFLDLSELVYMSIAVTVDALHWVRVFRNRALPRLAKVSIVASQKGAEEFVEALATPINTMPDPLVGSGPATASARYLFPDLKILQLDQIRVCLEPHRHPDHVLPPNMFAALERRAENGLILEKLVLNRPTNKVSDQDIAALKRLHIAQSVEVKQTWYSKVGVDLGPLPNVVDNDYDGLQDSSDVEEEDYHSDSVDEGQAADPDEDEGHRW